MPLHLKIDLQHLLIALQEAVNVLGGNYENLYFQGRPQR